MKCKVGCGPCDVVISRRCLCSEASVEFDKWNSIILSFLFRAPNNGGKIDITWLMKKIVQSLSIDSFVFIFIFPYLSNIRTILRNAKILTQI